MGTRAILHSLWEFTDSLKPVGGPWTPAGCLGSATIWEPMGVGWLQVSLERLGAQPPATQQLWEFPTLLVLDPWPPPHQEGHADPQSPAPTGQFPALRLPGWPGGGQRGRSPRAHTQLILCGCCLDKMRWERSRLRGRSHLAGICSLHVCPAFFGSSSTFEKPRFRFWPETSESRRSRCWERVGCCLRHLRSHPPPPPTFGALCSGGLFFFFPSCLLSPSTSLVFPRPGWEEAPPLGDAVREAAERTRAPRSLPDAGGWR